MDRQERQDRNPTVQTVADGVTLIDTVLGGEREFNAVYLLHGTEPTLVEAGPASDQEVILEGLSRLSVGPDDLAHIVVTHIHLDHAGGAGILARHHPRATVWVHERGVRHLVDPTRLVASTARTYGEDRMLELYGRTEPLPASRAQPIDGGDRIDLGARSLEVVHTPGHASHHVALQDTDTGVVFTGEAVGSHLPWADCYRPALPPPEVDVEMALASVDRILALRPSALMTSHFGPIHDVEAGCERAAQRIRSWSDAVRDTLTLDPDADLEHLTDVLRELASEEFLADSGRPIDLARYDVIGSIGMNAAGLSRYWRKRWEREAAADEGGRASAQ